MAPGKPPSPPFVTAQEAAARLRQIEARLQAVELELEHKDQLATIGLLTAGVAHEVNNLLCPLVAYAQLAQSKPGDTELARKCVERARVAGDTATQILRAILDFAKPGDDDEPLDASIGAALDAALTCLGRDLAMDRIDLRRSFASSLRLAMPRRALQQVLLNLLSNSRRELRARGGTIEVSARPRGGRVDLIVADNGPGLPPDLQSTLFDSFVTGHADGSGLGLAIVREAVERAGGTIVVETTPGGGATFRMDLPAAAAAARRAG